MIENLAADVVTSSNAFLVEGDRPALVDAGTTFDAVAAIRARVDTLGTVVLTHTHPDHVGNVDAVRAAFDVDVCGFDPGHPAVDRGLEDGARVTLGDHDYRALHTPGHAPDHLCFYGAEPGVLFSGDLVLRNGKVGRTDREGGDRERLLASIDALLETVDDDLRELHPGHGPSVAGDAFRHLELARRFAETL